jgi:hypothetical protein
MKKVLFLLFPLAMAGTAMAQEPVCSAQKIRDAVMKSTMQDTEDSFFWSGAYDKPLIGRAAQETGDKQRQAEAPRKNEAHPAEQPEKIEVSKSGDMAYEYGKGSMSFDSVKEGKHVSFQAAYLRVWKAANGECRVAATMFHPIESSIKETPIASK